MTEKIITLPGLVDLHVHCRDFGQQHKETYETASKAALAGGVIFVGDMPNNSNLIDNITRIEEKKVLASTQIATDMGIYLGTLGDENQNFEECYDHVLGLKVYMSETTGGFTVGDKDKLDHIFKKWNCQKPILVHAEDNTLPIAIELAEKYNQTLYVCHLSLKREIEWVQKAKEKRPGKVYAEVTPHHLFSNLLKDRKSPFNQMKPPLSEEEDRQALWGAINNGLIDTIGSDHAPHTKEEKLSIKHPFGVPGLETTLPLLLEAQSSGLVTLDKVIELTHINPIKIFGLTEQEDTFVEIQRGLPMIIRGENLQTKCKWTPFEGIEIQNTIARVVLRGKEVYNKNKGIIAATGSGKLL